MNITLLAMFLSTFTLIDADIDVTRRGVCDRPEANPIAATFTSAGNWNGLTATAYAANSAAFIGLGLLGHAAMGEELATAWQIIYIIGISAVECYALSQWNMTGTQVYVKVTPLYLIF